MKQLINILGLFLVFSQCAYALQPQSKRLAYEHLYEVNIQWQHFPQAAPDEYVQFSNDIDRIAYHLHHVESYLRANSPEGLSQKALANRMQLLDALKEYANAKVFPQNIYHKERTPYFIDHRGVHCAVGYLIKVSGHANLAQRIKKEHNYDYLKNIETPGVLQWAKEYGFTFKELEWIQPGYVFHDYRPVGGGVNGTVHAVASSSWPDYKLYIAGDFDSIAGTSACTGVAVYENNQLSCVMGGLTGDVADVSYVYGEGVTVSGHLEDQGVFYPIATHDNGNWTYQAISGRAGANGIFYDRSYLALNYDRTLVIEHSSIPGKQEVWMREINTANWTRKATIHGQLYDMKGDYYGGDFDSITIHGSVDMTYAYRNAVYYDGGLDQWAYVGNELPDVVKAVALAGNVVYFGGSSNDPDTGILIARYTPTTLAQTLITTQVMLDTSAASINTIDFYENQMVFAGKFITYPPIIGAVGENIAQYEVTSGFMNGMGYLYGEVHELLPMQNDLCVGGNLTAAGNVAKLEVISGTTTHPEDELLVKAFPNPNNGQFTINFEEIMTDIELTITDVSGKVMQQAAFSSQSQIELQLEAPAGLYLAKVVADGRQSLLKIVKQ